jgi:hypothetical protein
MKTMKLVFAILILIQFKISAQIGISANGVAPSQNAVLDISSTTKGLLIPRMNQAARNAIPDTKGMLIYNTDNDHFNFNNGTNWQNIGNFGDIPWEISGTSIYSSNAGNVGIGISTPTQAKLVVNGGVNSQVALFKSISGVSIYGGSSPNIGLNMDAGKAIDTGNALKIGLNSVGFDLDYFTSKATGVAFTGGSTIMEYQDMRTAGLGHWLNLLWGQDSRLLVPDIEKSKSNGNLNLVPIGVINFKVTGLGDGDNATTVIHNVGQTGGLYQNRYYFNVDTGSGIGSGFMNLILNLDFLTKDYEDIYIVGSPNFVNSGEETQAAFAKFYRNPVGTNDRIQIWFGSSFLSNSTEVFGTLMVYGTKIN